MMLTKTGRLALATAVLCIGFGRGGRAEAGGIAISTPAGLSPGDPFRIVFVTDAATDATSPFISTYNTFVSTDATNEAGGGLVTYNGVALTWSAIVSTAPSGSISVLPQVNAIDNVGVTGAPVYLANSGTLVATSDGTASGGLWSGTLSNAIDRDLNNTPDGDASVWTGTLANGTGNPGHQLGDSVPTDGSTTHANAFWVDNFTVFGNSGEQLLYGISQELFVSRGSVPEPSTLVMAVTAICAGCAFGLTRRRRK
jgi:hypothetical protein